MLSRLIIVQDWPISPFPLYTIKAGDLELPINFDPITSLAGIKLHQISRLGGLQTRTLKAEPFRHGGKSKVFRMDAKNAEDTEP